MDSVTFITADHAILVPGQNGIISSNQLSRGREPGGGKQTKTNQLTESSTHMLPPTNKAAEASEASSNLANVGPDVTWCACAFSQQSILHRIHCHGAPGGGICPWQTRKTFCRRSYDDCVPHVKKRDREKKKRNAATQLKVPQSGLDSLLEDEVIKIWMLWCRHWLMEEEGQVRTLPRS